MTATRSRRRSATTSKPHKRRADPRFRFPTIYIDECVSQLAVPDALRARGFQVLTRADVFPTGELQDPTWLTYCGQRRYVAITKDKAIKRRRPEIEALMRARVRMFTICAAHLTGEDQAALVVATIPAMRRWVQSTPAPFLVRILAGPRTELVAP